MDGYGTASAGTPVGQESALACLSTAVVDDHGVLREWGRGAERLLGYSSSEVVGRSATDLLFGRLSETIRRAFVARSPWSGEIDLRHRNGTSVAVELLAAPTAEEDGARRWSLVAVPGAERGPREEEELTQWAFEQSGFSTAIYDKDGRLLRLNDAAARSMGVSEDKARGLRLTQFVPGSPYAEHEEVILRTLETGEPAHIQAFVRAPGESRPRAWTLHVYPLKEPSGRVRGAWACALDVTVEHQARERLALLDEAGARIGTTLSVERTARELADVTVPRFADVASIDLLESVLRGEEPASSPAPGSFVLRRVACKTVPEDAVTSVTPGERRLLADDSPVGRCLASGVPVLVRPGNADFDHWAAQLPPAGQTRDGAVDSVMVVPLRARGHPLGVAVLARRGRPDPFVEDDLVLAGELVARAAVCVDNARRYTRERATAVALQQSLLPHRLPGHAAVEAAGRYLPADSRVGVGGDWFDVIPLSGARVALVVGDVVGHGIRASASMAGLRTAVRTLADVDLSPDELLTQLDDLVISRAADEELDEGDDVSSEIGATCLYAVYDPISRRCSIARAGHLQPAVVTPDGAVDFLDVPAGPPLGVGGLPFETLELELPEGSLLVLFTDGLVAACRARDVDLGLDRLRQALTVSAGPLETVCDNVLGRMLPDRSVDDVALLIVRTRALDADRVATWELPADPAVVAEVRRQAAARLAAWGLDDAVFIMELIISELVTNAIRYACEPIVLRLIHDHALICEVSDASATAPHLRRARTFDEGGRGLFLVAQFAQRWGARQTAVGKTIWAECAL
ncbi:SpoIIE family protein phosphatase [Streptomyces sp. NRRL S-813]|uniref:SpoIIE family protein phosphatase n=1 Tax=Streptomyces sp. NRRL S-813 TaxID=1463919 RepID=UPI0004C20AE0|nr:SpoIIE family protein phosphatase [Streptomyces sp. NRRL S-813]